jgi:hypothetical protein
MSDTTLVDGFALLRLRDYPRPLWFIVEYQFGDGSGDMEYYFEEYACPTNFIPVEEIIEDGDSDAHGLFEFVDWKPKPLDADEKGVDWALLFPQTAKGAIIEGHAAGRQELLG